MRLRTLKTVKTDYELAERHYWSAAPGCKVFVADRGAVRFDYPRTWIVRPTNDGIKFYDRKPPKDNLVLGISYLRIPLVDWTDLPLSGQVIQCTARSTRQILGWDPVVQTRKIDLEIAWRHGRFWDRKDDRPAFTRFCLARRRTVQALLTLDFWETELERCSAAWDVILASLELDEPITDVSRGPVRM
ncbi:MAG TPA: hypothetical protein VEW48_12300 [Thermoanaerobaculia bacterium]|nr:hypothetical protein [Thermoanaerobaculia bacterium]